MERCTTWKNIGTQHVVGLETAARLVRKVGGRPFARVIELPFTTGGDTASLDPFKVLRLGVAGSGGVIEFGLREGGAWRRDGRRA